MHNCLWFDYILLYQLRYTMTNKEHISLYVSAEVKERLVLLAKCNERSLTQYIELLITDRLPKQEKPEEHDLVAA
jgi:hypothetical protein